MGRDYGRPKFLRGIAVRIFVLSWLVSILTLTIFVTAIIPEQKQDLQDALSSKALGISSSLQEVTAGAALSEDYSTVVDHCVQVLAGDEAIDYIVVTKNDGLSVVVERHSWRMEKLDGFWRPAGRLATAGIQVVPNLNRRVFQFTRPFDYSSLQWGWIHVGLSLATYDRSVSRIYQRTWLIAVICMALSLLASVIYAKLQVRPIRNLQAVVGQVAEGNLSARAALHGGEELESLARSFNTMADSLSQRNQILESVRFAAQQFLTAADLSEVVVEVLSKVGHAAGASRAFVVENHSSDGVARHGLRYDWPAPDARTPMPAFLVPIRNGVLEDQWARQLRQGEIVCVCSRGSGSPQSTSSDPAQEIFLIPIHAGGEWFGFLGFCDNVREHDWSEPERDSFRAVAGMLGASITRQRVQDALVEAKESLEERVTERTRELQDQVNAKERALAELAEAQQRLIELSRMSGMAEIATGVLHNVGNVLNSVNVSATIASGKILEFRVDKLVTAVKLLEQHPDDMDAFLRHDPKGQRVMPYLGKLGKDLQEDRQEALKELRQLQSHVDHIKTIVATQQSYAKVSGLVEDVCLADLVEDALHIVQPGLDRHRIVVERAFEAVPPIVADKHKILQILLNLFRNAKEAIKQGGPESRFIRIRIRCVDDRVRIEVKDSGIGLSPENLTRIFAHGFTTKTNGHGFGLHSGALAAQQMSGSVWAESDGPGQGATFILDLPLIRAQERSLA